MSTPNLPYSFFYASHHLLTESSTPHVTLDCITDASTLLNLSHSNPNVTLEVYKRDTSTEICLAFLERPETGLAEIAKKANDFGQKDASGSIPVTVNHLDEDGLYSLFCLVNPVYARENAGLLKLLATCGDFTRLPLDSAGQIGKDAELAAKITILIGLITGRYRQSLAIEKSRAGQAPYPPSEIWGAGGKPRHEVVEGVYSYLLSRLPTLIDEVQKGLYESVWGPDWKAILETIGLLREDGLKMTGYPNMDLLSVSVPFELPMVKNATSQPHLSTFPHNIALHSTLSSQTDRNRILVHCGKVPVFYIRYESRVRIVSRKVAERPVEGFKKIVAKLDAMEKEKGGLGTWTGEVMERVTPRLFCAGVDGEPGESVLEFAEIEQAIKVWLGGLDEKGAQL
jgi:hypothetical protein